jgi:hypothetical protein
MDKETLQKYLNYITDGIENGESGISFQDVTTRFKHLMETNSDFEKYWKDIAIDKKKSLSLLLKKLIPLEIERRNKLYYKDKLDISKIDIDFIINYFPSDLFTPIKNGEIIEEELIHHYKKTINKVLSLEELGDLVHCIYVVGYVITLQVLGMGYRWIPRNCPLHKDSLAFIDCNAVFEFDKPDKVLFGYDGYIWKNRQNLHIPNGIPGQCDYLCKCEPIPTWTNTDEKEWENIKAQHIKDEEQKKKGVENKDFRFKYLQNTKYVFTSIEEYETFKLKIFDDTFIQYPFLSLVTYYYRAKIYLENKDFENLNKCIMAMTTVKVSYDCRKDFFKDILDLLSIDENLSSKYDAIFKNVPKKTNKEMHEAN